MRQMGQGNQNQESLPLYFPSVLFPNVPGPFGHSMGLSVSFRRQNWGQPSKMIRLKESKKEEGRRERKETWRSGGEEMKKACAGGRKRGAARGGGTMEVSGRPRRTVPAARPRACLGPAAAHCAACGL